MDFQLSEEQQLLADSVRRLFDNNYDFESRKKIVASAQGSSDDTWAKLAEFGLLGLPLSEDSGGFGGGANDLIPVMEAIGEALVLEPFAPTIAMARLVERAGSPAQRDALLGSVIEGSCRLALACTEPGSRYDQTAIAASARRDGEGWVLDGSKINVIGAPQAHQLIVSARTSGKPGEKDGVSLFLVPANAGGLTQKTYRTQDSLRAADITLAGVKLGDDALIGTAGQGLAALDEALDFVSALLCAEAVGAMKFACDTTLEYLKTRKQFGVPIGAFQALQHRMVDMYICTEQSRSITYLACARVDGSTDVAERRRVVSAARVKIAEAARQVGQEAIQLHGGMGMTLEMKVSHTFKRLTMISQAFGDADYFIERFAH
ncbi:MAG: acyl-CoA dehydrogenase family protein [Quisquiliibacterium sp.]